MDAYIVIPKELVREEEYAIDAFSDALTTEFNAASSLYWESKTHYACRVEDSSEEIDTAGLSHQFSYEANEAYSTTFEEVAGGKPEQEDYGFSAKFWDDVKGKSFFIAKGVKL